MPLEPNRTVSVFRERVEKHKDELAELEVLENVQEKERPVSSNDFLLATRRCDGHSTFLYLIAKVTQNFALPT